MDAALQLVVLPSGGRDTDRALLDAYGTITRSCPDCDRDHGRPVVAEPGRWVSLSRSGGFVAVAFSTLGPVGVDLESEAAVVRHATDAFVAGEHPDARTWTTKEAALKADGRGLRVDPRDLRVIDGRVVEWREGPFALETLQVGEFAVTDDLVGCVVWSGRAAAVDLSGGWAALSHRASGASIAEHPDPAGSPTEPR